MSLQNVYLVDVETFHRVSKNFDLLRALKKFMAIHSVVVEIFQFGS